MGKAVHLTIQNFEIDIERKVYPLRASFGECKIEEILKQNGLTFKMEYIFPELRSPNGRPLRFDFVVFDDDGKIDFIIEY